MISRLEAGYSAEHMTDVDLNAIVSDVVELYEPVAEEEGVRLQSSVEGENRIQGNRELIGQALSNIIDNAIKYSARSGDLPTATVSLAANGQAISLTVNDNGPGIPEDDRVRATERFVRLEKSRSRPGSGLGLSLAKAVMKLHGGRLDLSGREPGLSVAMVFPAEQGGRKA